MLCPVADDDATLLAAWRDGDTRAGSRLFDRHYTRLARFFRNKVGDEHYDLTQQTMLTCLERCDQLRDDQRFAAFLLGVARNVLLHHYRTRARKLDKLDFGVSAVADLAPGGSTILARRHEHKLLLEALRALPLEQQILLELYYWEELRGGDLARFYGLPEGTIRTRLRAARQALEGTLPKVARQLGIEVTNAADNLETWAREVRPLLEV
ncbi:RNA polymerase sigma factor (sigma24) [Plesiocystis pacifica SIR-1]|uniref:RNA polymerase sigma factor (Sigma24) n=1 Tax=Plesiocystis pacifica SIR-1 TaxID=391625 RepID=A6G0G3_9BACT|nr:RNA polymerase sigma factor (sigma24) [Plesiocystis pacifica SIR-1]